MLRYVVHRTIDSPIAIFGVLLVVFVFLLTTGDPVEIFVPPEATELDKELIRVSYGLDKPLWHQFGLFLSRAVRGDFGDSFFRGDSALSLVLSRLPASVELAFAAALIAVLIGPPLGIIAAMKRGTIIDQGVMLLALLGQSIAGFWLAFMLILVFGIWFNLLPVAGREDGIKSLVLPALALSFWQTALLARLTRSGMLEVIREDYVRTARAKGLTGKIILIRHELRNVLIPLVTITGLSMGWLIGGAVVIETVFAWPGLGSLLLDSVFKRDFPVVLAGVTVLAVIFITINLLVDILYGYLDPRIRFGSR